MLSLLWLFSGVVVDDGEVGRYSIVFVEHLHFTRLVLVGGVFFFVILVALVTVGLRWLSVDCFNVRSRINQKIINFFFTLFLFLLLFFFLFFLLLITFSWRTITFLFLWISLIINNFEVASFGGWIAWLLINIKRLLIFNTIIVLLWSIIHNLWLWIKLWCLLNRWFRCVGAVPV